MIKKNINWVKNIKISEETHTDLKVFCAKNKLSLDGGIKKLLKNNDA